MSTVVSTPRLGGQSSGALFQKLYPRPNGLSRAQVISHQRERLCRAMLTAVVRQGYERATVSELCSLAGVSKRSFYEIFGGKPDCLAAAHERVVCQAARRMHQAPRADGRPQESLQAALSVLLEEAVRRPDATRFALLDAVDATAAALERRRWAALQFEREIADRLADVDRLAGVDPLADGRRATVSQLALRGIVAGLSHVVCTRLLDGRTEELPQLADELTRWALACARLIPKPPPDGLGVRASSLGTPRSQAHGARHSPTAPSVKLFASRNDGALLMESALLLVAEGGMLRLSPGALASRSGVPTRRLHALFGDCEQCLLEALRRAGEQLLDDAIGGAAEESQSRLGVQRGLLALFRDLDAHRAFTRGLFVETLSLGSRAQPVKAALVARAANALRRALPAASPSPSDVACEASVAAVWELVADEVLNAGAGPGRLRSLAASAQGLLLAPGLRTLVPGPKV